jgi:predicted TIM-barrel fold metal-dependent hydrolase
MEQAFFLVRRFANVFMDVSGIPPKTVLRYFPRLADVADKVLYGSDWPSQGVKSMAANVNAFRALDLPADALAKILDGNSRKLFS